MKDIETIQHEYIVLRNLHKIANNVNEKLLETNDKCKNDILILKEQTIELSDKVARLQKQLTESFVRLNDVKNDYNGLIAGLQDKIQKLEQE